MENMEKQNFNFRNCPNCSFGVSYYLENDKAIAILIINDITNEIMSISTIYIPDEQYSVGMATIKNYSENKGMTNFLQEQGIVSEILRSDKVNELAEDTETIDICKIDLQKLKEYATVWYYEESEGK